MESKKNGTARLYELRLQKRDPVTGAKQLVFKLRAILTDLRALDAFLAHGIARDPNVQLCVVDVEDYKQRYANRGPDFKPCNLGCDFCDIYRDWQETKECDVSGPDWSQPPTYHFRDAVRDNEAWRKADAIMAEAMAVILKSAMNPPMTKPETPKTPAGENIVVNPGDFFNLLNKTIKDECDCPGCRERRRKEKEAMDSLTKTNNIHNGG